MRGNVEIEEKMKEIKERNYTVEGLIKGERLMER
jgi:hypothetical protein